MRTLIFGAIGGLIGAVAWTAVATQTEVQGGWTMCIVGVLAGVASRLAAKGKPQRAAAGSAAAITFVGIILGKVGIAAVAFLSTPALHELTENDFIAQIARNNVEEIELDGGFVEWPAGADPVHPDTVTDFPSDIWFAAARQWRTMTPERKDSFELAYFGKPEDREDKRFAAGVTALKSVSPFDAFWLILSVCVAPLLACARPFSTDVFHRDEPVRVARPSAGPLASMPPPTQEEMSHGIRGLPRAGQEPSEPGIEAVRQAAPQETAPREPTEPDAEQHPADDQRAA